MPATAGNQYSAPRSGGPTIVWFRDDLRIADNPAIVAAIDRGEAIVFVYVLDDVSTGIRPLGGASHWWLHHSLEHLAASISALGATLVLRRGPAAAVMRDLVAETDAGALFWNRRYGEAERNIDADIKTWVAREGREATSFGANLLFEPWTISNDAGDPYRVFTPFWRACLSGSEPRRPLPAPDSVVGCAGKVRSERLEDWELLPTAPDWAGGLRAANAPGERAAMERLEAFASHGLDRYSAQRDRPAALGTSRLSPHLRWGEISPFQVWHHIQQARRAGAGDDDSNASSFLAEIGWREFNYSLLFYSPDLATRNVDPRFDAFEWEPADGETLAAWQQGRTGYPLVDAGMRALWETGTLHNRVRMVVASFLVKNLRIDWRIGEAWFWDTLVDADPANNPANWQWVAGSGADAAPYFRVFNPVLQSRKFDRDGEYIRTYVPELAHLSSRDIHQPGTARGDLVALAEGDDLGQYPEPIVDLSASRREALAAYDRMREA